MLIPMAEVAGRWGCRLGRVVHAGAHLCEEAADYAAHGAEVLWVEADPLLIPRIEARLADYPGQRAVQALLGQTSGVDMLFHRASNDGMSSSVLNLGTHRKSSPEVQFAGDVTLTSRTLDDVVGDAGFGPVDGVQLDLQGFELDVLRGASALLGEVGWVYLEVNVQEVYEGCGLLWDVDDLLVGAGFECRRVLLAGDQRRGGRRWHGWGDGLWTRADDPRPVDVAVPESKRWRL